MIRGGGFGGGGGGGLGGGGGGGQFTGTQSVYAKCSRPLTTLTFRYLPRPRSNLTFILPAFFVQYLFKF